MTLYKFCRESGEEITTTPEKWRWEAHYTDGTALLQFDDKEERFHQFKEIDQNRLHYFAMVSEGKPPLILHWKPGWKLIHFYMRYRLDVGGPNERRLTVYVFGYQDGGHKVLTCIMPDDAIIITNDHEKVKITGEA
jgi:hypothetical protein